MVRTAAWIVLVCAGCVEDVAPTPSTPDDDTAVDTAVDTAAEAPADLTVDVLVIGAGGAGLAAAIEASRAGATVLVLEREEAPQENLPHSWLFSGSAEQAAAGVEDSAAQLLGEWQDLTGGDPEDPWVVAFSEGNVPEVRDWLADLGATFALDGCDRCDGMGSVRRLHTGVIPIEVLTGALPEGAIRTRTAATALVTDASGVVIGAGYEDWGAGETGWVAATRTIVATGGFLADLDRVRGYRAELVSIDLWYDCTAWADGNGIDLVTAVGGTMENPAAIGLYANGYPDPVSGGAAHDPSVTAGVWVNQAGERFTDETAPLSYASGEAVAAQDGGVAWVILDATMQAAITLEDELREYPLAYADIEDAGYATSASTLEGLAAAVGVDEAGLVATIDAYNAAIRAGEPDAWQTSGTVGQPIEAAPYYAVRLALSVTKAFGGVSVDEGGRVLDANGAVVPGVLAAGEFTGMAGGSLVGAGFSDGGGHGFNGSISAVVLSGRVAGATAAEEAL